MNKKIIVLMAMVIAVGGYAQVTTPISTTYSGGNGTNGTVDFSILANPASGQATLGAEVAADSWSNLILGSNIAGTRRFWSFSKRTSAESHDLQLMYYDGATFSQNPLMSFRSSGRVGVGLPYPEHTLQIHSANNPTFAIGKLNENTNGKATLSFFAGSSTHRNGFSLQYFKDSSTDRLGFIDGGSVEVLTLKNGGSVGIGTTNPGSYKLAVEGKIGAREVIVTTAPWADYVFESDYKLPSLYEVEQFIKKNKHLPEVPTTDEVNANGVNVGEMSALLLKKVEELTLYLIELKKENEQLKIQNEKQDQLLRKIFNK